MLNGRPCSQTLLVLAGLAAVSSIKDGTASPETVAVLAYAVEALRRI